MKAAIVHSFDAPPRYDTFAEPVVGEGELLVEVTAAGLHPIVKSLANGTHYGSTGELPFIPGVDGVGRLPDGSRVYFGISRPPFGTFAPYALANRAMCLPLPEALPDAIVAAIANPGMSSWAALKGRAQMVEGESVLILGATGVAGRLAVQIAKRLGARRVVAAGRNPKMLEKLPGLGADAVFSLDQEHDAVVAAFRQAWADGGVDVVLDYLWGEPAERLLAAVSRKGLQHKAARLRYIQVGASAGSNISLPAATLRSSGLELLGSGFGSASLEGLRQSIAEFLKQAATTPFVFETETAPLRDVEALWNRPEKTARLVFQP
jgi:NADPH:quinone reductase-like Zn-dependent oxidoreductase